MSRPLVWAAGGFVLGELCAQMPGYLGAVSAALLCLAWAAALAWLRPKGAGWLRAAVPVLVLLGAAVCRQDQQAQRQQRELAAALLGRPLEIEGYLEDIGENQWSLALELSEARLWGGGVSGEFPGLLVYVSWEELKDFPDWEDQLHIGQKVRLQGEAEPFPLPGNSGQFDFGAYYYALGIGARAEGRHLRPAGSGYRWFPDALYRLRRQAGRVLEQICGPEDLGVFQAVVLGDKSRLPEEIQKLYQENGISHLLAVSGLHVSMIGQGFYLLLRRGGAGRKLAGAAGAAVTVSYGALTGGSASAVRAVLMLLFRFAADGLGRTYDSLSALSAAAQLLLAPSPSLLFQAGFQLSFGAVIAINGLGRILARRLEGPVRLIPALAAGIAVQAVTYPMTSWHFFEYPAYSIVLNLLVIPLMGYVLASGLAGIGLGFWMPEAGRFAVGTGHYVLALYRWLCRGFGSLPGSLLITGRPALWQAALYTGLWAAAAWFWHGRNRRERRWRLEKRKEPEPDLKRQLRRLALLAAALPAGFLLLRLLPPQGLEAAFLDVGQGDAVCLRTAEGVVLSDAGSSDRKDLGEDILEPYLKSLGVSTVDCAVVSHADQDHISGLEYLLEADCGIRIRHLALPWLGQGDEAYEELTRLAEQAGTGVWWVREGDILEAGDLRLRCLYAGSPEAAEDRNAHSLLLEASYGNACLLLTGDMSQEGEEEWLKRQQTEPGLRLSRPVQMLKAAHHGSAASSGEAFLAEVSPVWAVISCGRDNSYGHPSPEVLERLGRQGVRVFQTMEQGAVFVFSDGQKVWARTFRQGPESAGTFQ